MRVLKYAQFRQAEPDSSLEIPLLADLLDELDKILFGGVFRKLF